MERTAPIQQRLNPPAFVRARGSASANKEFGVWRAQEALPDGRTGAGSLVSQDLRSGYHEKPEPGQDNVIIVFLKLRTGFITGRAATTRGRAKPALKHTLPKVYSVCSIMWMKEEPRRAPDPPPNGAYLPHHHMKAENIRRPCRLLGS